MFLILWLYFLFDGYYASHSDMLGPDLFERNWFMNNFVAIGLQGQNRGVKDVLFTSNRKF